MSMCAARLWASPYDIDVPNALRPGVNNVEADVTNEWTNRLIGDRDLPEPRRVLHAFPARPGPVPSLQESGLIGNVLLVERPPFLSAVSAGPFRRLVHGSTFCYIH